MSTSDLHRRRPSAVMVGANDATSPGGWDCFVGLMPPRNNESGARGFLDSGRVTVSGPSLGEASNSASDSPLPGGFRDER
jgi:hypothetical protein